MTVTASQTVTIHDFKPGCEPSYDEEGDQRLGVYYQFENAHGEPITGLIGPYRTCSMAERAAYMAFKRRDF